MHAADALFLLLWILNLGTAFGAGLYETLMVLPTWFPLQHGKPLAIDSKLMREADVGRRFWGMVTTLPLTLLTLANCYFALHASGPRRSYWLAAVAIVALERVLTFTFFIPAALAFMKLEAAASPAERKLAATWINLNYARNLLILAGWLCALYVFGGGAAPFV
jgi:hypothetical protein